MNVRPGVFKTRFMSGTIAVALVSAVTWSFIQLAQSRDSEAAAGQDLAECRALTAHIALLRGRPGVAQERQLPAEDLSRRIEQAAGAAEFADGSIERIEPQPPRRIGETDYSEVATQVQLRQVTLRQVFTFLHALSDHPSQSPGDARQSVLSVRDIRLSAPHGGETGERWTVESTLTYTVYAPRGKTDSAGTSSGVVAER